MSGTRTQRLAELFEAAIDIADSTARERYLDEHCTADAALREEVERLLRHDAREGDTFLRSPVAAADEQAHAQLRAGDVIGRRYTLVRQLGAGGMGVVWLARQDHPAREVALKMLRPGVASRQALRRFEFEAMVLGRLQHPGIAQVYDAGMHDDGDPIRDESRMGTPGWGGQPYFVMEYIAGTLLNEFVNTADLDRPERLALVARICDAVHHAHQKGVIHRDLKPGNILVVRGDDGPQPKILDFGVARVLEPDEQVATLHTSHGQLVGTLPYMSPEQVAGDPDHIDARSDVYALGVILYGLVTGRLPFDFSKMTVAMAAKTIVESEPIAPAAIDRSLRGDLNTIILKALTKTIERRYASAAALSADIRHVLAREPIQARPVSRAYHMRQFARRNKALVAGLSAAVLALCAGTVASTWAMLGAQGQAQRAQAINAFLRDVLVAANTGASGDVRLVDLLEDASERVDAEFGNHPDLAMEVHELLGAAFHAVARYDMAEYHSRRHLALAEVRWGRGHALTRRPRANIVEALMEQFRLREADEVIRGLVDGPEAGIRDDAWFVAQARRAEIMRFRGAFAEAVALLRSALDEARRARDPTDVTVLRLTYALAEATYHDAEFGGHSPQRIREFREEEAALLWQVIEHPAAPGTYLDWHARIDLADFATYEGRQEDALALLMEACDVIKEYVGAEHPLMADAEIKLAMALAGLGRFTEAASCVTHAVAVARANDASSPNTLAIMTDALPILDSAGEWATALEYANDLAQRFMGQEGAHGSLPVAYRVWQAYLYARLNDPDSAGAILDEVSAREREMSDRERCGLYYALGIWALATNDRAAARVHLEHARDLRLQSAPGPWPDAQKIQEEIDRLDG